MNIGKNIVKYLDNTGWENVYEGAFMHHYKILKDDNVHHLYITYLESSDEYEVELGVGDTQDTSEIFKLRNIVSVLKRRGF